MARRAGVGIGTIVFGTYSEVQCRGNSEVESGGVQGGEAVTTGDRCAAEAHEYSIGPAEYGPRGGSGTGSLYRGKEKPQPQRKTTLRSWSTISTAVTAVGPRLCSSGALRAVRLSR